MYIHKTAKGLRRSPPPHQNFKAKNNQSSTKVTLTSHQKCSDFWIPSCFNWIFSANRLQWRCREILGEGEQESFREKMIGQLKTHSFLSTLIKWNIKCWSWLKLNFQFPDHSYLVLPSWSFLGLGRLRVEPTSHLFLPTGRGGSFLPVPVHHVIQTH